MSYVYHRNGVSGFPFWVKCGDKNLTIVFVSKDDPDGGPADSSPRIKVSRTLIAEALDALRRTDKSQIVKRTFKVGAVAFNGAGSRMIGVTDLFRPNDRRYAVLNIERLPDVRFGWNSYRGDNFVATIDHILEGSPS